MFLLKRFLVAIVFKNTSFINQKFSILELKKDKDTYCILGWKSKDLFKLKFYIKNCLFATTNTAKNTDKSEYMYTGYGTTFVGKGKWNSHNDFSRTVTIIGVDNLILIIIYLIFHY